MSDIAKTVGPDLVPASVLHLDGLLGPLAAYLDALEARVAALERRLSAVPLMTAADAARYTRVNVETILRAVRASELPAAATLAARLGSLAMPSQLACREIGRGGTGSFAAPPPSAAKGEAMPSRQHGRRWAECRAPARSQRPALPSARTAM